MRGLARVVGGIRPLVLHGSNDVLVGRQLGGAVAEVTLAHGELVAAHHLVVARHAERRRVHGPDGGGGGDESLFVP